jgi:hypothetical protein
MITTAPYTFEQLLDNIEKVTHDFDAPSTRPLLCTIEEALAVYLAINSTTNNIHESADTFRDAVINNTLNKHRPSQSDVILADTLLSYWSNKLFMAKLSDTIVMTSWRTKLMSLCTRRCEPMTENDLLILMTLEKITEYEERSDAIAMNYVSHDNDGYTSKTQVEGLELCLIEMYRHTNKRESNTIYRFADDCNRVYEVIIGKQRSGGQFDDADVTISAQSIFESLLRTSRRFRVNAWTKTMPLNNITHNKFSVKKLARITSIDPI